MNIIQQDYFPIGLGGTQVLVFSNGIEAIPVLIYLIPNTGFIVTCI